MNDQRLAQLLRQADERDLSPALADASRIASSARAIRHRRQQNARFATATCAMVIVVGVIALISPRNGPQPLPDRRVALQDECQQLDEEAANRMVAINSVERSRKSQNSARSHGTLPRSSRDYRDYSVQLDVERERAAAIILQAADQLREAGRSDLASNRYNDLITLFPDTAAAESARQHIAGVKNRT